MLNAAVAADVTAHIADRAYDLYEEGGRRDGHALQDWRKAEQEFGLGESQAKVRANAEADPAPEAKPEPDAEAAAPSAAAATAEPVTATKPQPPHDATRGRTPNAKTEPKAGA